MSCTESTILNEDRLLDIGKEIITRSAPLIEPTLFLPGIERDYPNLGKLMITCGIHPLVRTELINPFTDEIDREYYGNIGEHSLAVGAGVNAIGHRLVDTGVLPQESYQQAVIEGTVEDFLKVMEITRRKGLLVPAVRGLIHDAPKVLEIQGKKAIRSGDLTYESVYSEIAQRKAITTLIERGVPSDLQEYLFKAGRETGHLSLPMFVTINPEGKPTLKEGLLMEKLVHLVDDMCATTIPEVDKPAETRFVTAWEKMILTNFKLKYPWLWIKGFGFDIRGEPVMVDDINDLEKGVTEARSFAAWQVMVSNAICREIGKSIDPNNINLTVYPEYVLKNWLNSQMAEIQAGLYIQASPVALSSALLGLAKYLQGGRYY